MLTKKQLQLFNIFQKNKFNELSFKELKRLSKYLKDKKDYIIFAKSVGVILALKAISDKKLKKLKPSKCIFAGMAFSWAKLQNIDLNSLFKNYEVPTLFIQNSNDPAIPFHQLTEFLTQTQIKSYQITKFSGNEHKYDDIEKLSNLISQYS